MIYKTKMETLEGQLERLRLADEAELSELLSHLHIREEEQNRARYSNLRTRYDRIIHQVGARATDGDAVLANVRDVFHNGLGIQWGEDQVRIFNTALFSCLPLIYGKTWPENKARVLNEWSDDEKKVERECPYTIVVMGRRNGKTFVVSGFVAAMLRCVSNIKIAIFSTCTRTSYMMMSAIMDMIDKALALGTHFTEQSFAEEKRNMETAEYRCQDGTKRILGCFPGSVRVILSLFWAGKTHKPRLLTPQRAQGKLKMRTFYLGVEFVLCLVWLALSITANAAGADVGLRAALLGSTGHFAAPAALSWNSSGALYTRVALGLLVSVGTDVNNILRVTLHAPSTSAFWALALALYGAFLTSTALGLVARCRGAR
jgi:hypothetical protein